jgi:VIT1/CCC1 family predicted Fe2+/Mn2+ transporter
MANQDKHIKEKSVVEHLAKARQKGYLASVELHNFGFSSKLFSFMDAFRDGIILFTLILLCASQMIWPLAVGFALWRGLKITLQGFMRLERLHFLIEEEKYEIDHHRDEEKQELMAMYEAKGFKGAILEEVVATLMADDNRLLQIMLEEEMGVSFETLDHPVVSGSMATLGTFAALGLLMALTLVPFGIIVGPLLLIMITSLYETKKQQLPSFMHVTWSLASLLFVFTISYFINKIFA